MPRFLSMKMKSMIMRDKSQLNRARANKNAQPPKEEPKPIQKSNSSDFSYQKLDQ